MNATVSSEHKYAHSGNSIEHMIYWHKQTRNTLQSKQNTPFNCEISCWMVSLLLTDDSKAYTQIYM